MDQQGNRVEIVHVGNRQRQRGALAGLQRGVGGSNRNCAAGVAAGVIGRHHRRIHLCPGVAGRSGAAAWRCRRRGHAGRRCLRLPLILSVNPHIGIGSGGQRAQIVSAVIEGKRITCGVSTIRTSWSDHFFADVRREVLQERNLARFPECRSGSSWDRARSARPVRSLRRLSGGYRARFCAG